MKNKNSTTSLLGALLELVRARRAHRQALRREARPRVRLLAWLRYRAPHRPMSQRGVAPRDRPWMAPVTEVTEVLDTIDGAIADWEVSGDAMRWKPAVDLDDEAVANPVQGLLELQATINRLALTAWQEAFARFALEMAASHQRIVVSLARGWGRAAARSDIRAALDALATAAETPACRTVSASEEATGGSSTDQPPSLAGARFDSGVSAKRDRPAYVSPYGPAPKRRVR